MTNPPELVWDVGTAYDLFISLYTLHHPKDFALRGAWAVGVRSRLPTAEREFLQEIMEFFHWPADWVYDLPAPKDAQTAIDMLAETPPAQRLPALHKTDPNTAWGQVLLNIVHKESWTEQDETQLQRISAEEQVNLGKKPQRNDFRPWLKWWAQSAEFGERYLSALQEYHQSFFAEDERRIRPALTAALTHAQNLADTLSLTHLLEELSQGIKFEEPPQTKKLILAPSYWGSPLLFYGMHSKEHQIILFGGRPATASIVPGELIPDALFNSLKALADPTRLRILRYLIAEPLTPTELAARLRLRAPTVVHHLHTLRLARLVHLKFSVEGKKYQARREAVAHTYELLNSFLDDDSLVDLGVGEEESGE